MRDMGIYIQEEKVFYYLEAGDNYIGNTIDRIKKTMTMHVLLFESSGEKDRVAGYQTFRCVLCGYHLWHLNDP